MRQSFLFAAVLVAVHPTATDACTSADRCAEPAQSIPLVNPTIRVIQGDPDAPVPDWLTDPQAELVIDHYGHPVELTLSDRQAADFWAP